MSQARAHYGWIIATAILILAISPCSGQAAEKAEWGLSCPHRLPDSVEKAYAKDWTIEGTGELELDDIEIWVDGRDEDGVTLDPIDVTKAWVGSPINTELETSTYRITHEASIGCSYGEGATALARAIPPGVRSCKIIRDSRHLLGDPQLRIMCQ
jgi:hypothetical protein